MSTVLVRYRIARTGQPVPSGSPPPPDYVPWPHAPITWRRIESDYGPGIVRPRDSITTRADEHGEGAVYLAPGRYRITLPSRDTRDVTVSAEPAEIDLSSLLAGGIEPEDPQYPTLAAYVVDQIGVALEDQLDAIDEAVETAEESATTAQEARDAAIAAQAVTEAARDAAIEAQGLAEGARDAAEGYATTAGTARDQAVAAQGAAESAASAASSHASAAAGSASAAAGSATAAQTAREGAESAEGRAQGYATTAGTHATQTGLDAAATAADRLAVAADRQAIETEQAARLAAIQTAGDTQVGRVEDEGTAQVALIEGAGQGRLLPADAPDRSIAQRQGGAWVAIPYPEIVLVNRFAPIAPGMAGWRISNADVSASDGIATVHPTGAPSAIDHHLGSVRFSGTEGHLWYCAADVIGTAESLRFYYTNLYRWTNPTTGEWVRMSLVTDSHLTNRGFGWRDTDLAEFHVSRPILIDLTATFGAGNEPSVDEMEELISRLPDRHFDGTIRIPLVEWVDARTTALFRILQEA